MFGGYKAKVIFKLGRLLLNNAELAQLQGVNAALAWIREHVVSQASELATQAASPAGIPAAIKGFAEATIQQGGVICLLHPNPLIARLGFLAVHAYVVIQNLRVGQGWDPLRNLIADPASCRQRFFPGMPEDTSAEIMAYLQSLGAQAGVTSVVHMPQWSPLRNQRLWVTRCGRPMQRVWRCDWWAESRFNWWKCGGCSNG